MAMIRRQEGSAIVTALMLVTLMLTMSFAAISFVDSQQRDSGRDRKRESTFVVTEGVLNTQIFLMSRQWPGTVSTAYPSACTKANAADLRCPDDPRLATSFRGPDYDAGITWSTEIRDNVIPAAENFYDETAMGNPAIPTWDANQDSYMWVRSQAVLPDGKSRTLVALVKAEELATNFPKHAVVAGSIDVSQNGNHTYIHTRDEDTGEAGRVVVRCSPPSAAGCAKENKPNHISPAEVESNPLQKPAMSPEGIDQLREAARANGTYFKGGADCPYSLQGNQPGEIVFIESAAGCEGRFGDNKAVYNTAEKPGVVVIGSGHFVLEGPTYYGLIYHVNGSDGVGPAVGNGNPAVTTKNNSVVIGAIIIDGDGRLHVGNNNGTKGFPGNIVFDGGARNALKAFGTAGIVQNSFREIQPLR